eukprot:8454009-Pyramimonas_sp.AAC.1
MTTGLPLPPRPPQKVRKRRSPPLPTCQYYLPRLPSCDWLTTGIFLASLCVIGMSYMSIAPGVLRGYKGGLFGSALRGYELVVLELR